MSQFSFEQECRALALAPPIPAPGFNGFNLFQPQLNPHGIPGADQLPQVFGKRMERLFSQMLQNHNRYQLLGENLQVIDDGHTLGELDFLIRDLKHDQALHVEMACKFYLYRPEENSRPLQPWVGPNLKDRLESKLEKLREKQFPLLHHKQTAKLLHQLNLTVEEIQQHLYLPGLLFTPMEFKQIPEAINPGALSGSYFSFREFLDQNRKNDLFHIPQKRHWLIPPQWNTEWQNFEETVAELENWLAQKRSPMLWAKYPDGSCQRLFVVWW